VWTARNSVHFAAKQGTYSDCEIYTGFGLFVTASLVFEAWLVWFLAWMAARGSGEARAIAWALCALHVVGAGLSLRYFAAPQVLLSLAAAVCLAMGAVSMSRMRLAVPAYAKA
jgi:hypothetical protein